jgi:hypothetical protein
VAETVSRRAIARGWEGLLRLATSVKHGWYPATEALDRFGSAAAGGPVFEASEALGRLLRTLYLCDFFANPVFRIEILDLLNQGEAVHRLQRAVYNGIITAKHGRTMEELGAISGALALLANIIMAWNTPPSVRRRPAAGGVSRGGAEEHCADRPQAHQSARHPDVRPVTAWVEPPRAPSRGRP